MSTIVFTQTSTPQQQQQPSQTRPDTLPIKPPSTTQQPTLISPILTITRTDSIVTNEDHRIPKSPCCHGNESNEHETCSLINESNNVVICGEATITTTARSPTVTNSSLLTVTNGSADVCRICHCGPNTLATPTPQLLTPVTSPKKRENNSSKLKPVIINTNTPPNLLLPSSSSNNTQQQPLQSPKKQLEEDYDLISPCICSGSLKYVHQCCLQHWIRSSNNTACELCKHPYELRSKFKPVWKWEGLPLGGREKKRIVCSAVFHFVALACVVWSLYVLIARTIEELTRSDLEWQFWTKIIVEAIGCLGAGILTYVWGKSYVILLLKWVSYNRSFVILGKKDRKNSSNLECGLNSINKNTTGVQSQSDDLLCDGDNLSVVVRGEGQQQQQQQCLLDDDGQELIQLIK